MDHNRKMFEEFIQGFMAREKQNTLERYRRLNQYVRKGETLFVGSSLMEQFPLYELKMSLGIPGIAYNRGIGGFTTTELLDVMDTCIFDLAPSRIFINIGSNDMAGLGFTIEDLRSNYQRIVQLINDRLPDCQITLMAYYPINTACALPGFGDMFATRNNKTIQACNQMVENLASETGCRFINVNQGLLDENGNLKADFTIEGLHMWPDAYHAVLGELRPYIED